MIKFLLAIILLLSPYICQAEDVITDFNSPSAISIINELIRKVNSLARINLGKVKFSSTDTSPGFLSSKIDGTTLEVSGDQLKVGTITADEINVSQLSAISANVGTLTVGTIGGWTINPSTLSSPENKIVLDNTNKKITVGNPAGSYLNIDGENARIQTSDFASGALGSGWSVNNNTAEFNNIRARGKITTAVFEKETVSSVGGNLLVSDSDILNADMTALDASTLTTLGDTNFATGDTLRIKDGVDDEWLEVTGVNGNVYTVTRDKAAAYTADTNPLWKKGTATINYGASGEGLIYITASESNAPYLSVLTHAGSPWTTTTTQMRLGNLNGYLDYVTNLYGIAIGKSDAYLKYDPTNGLRIKGSIEVTGGTATQTFAQDGIPTSICTGDLWIDTNDSNKLYRAASVGADQIIAGEWVEVTSTSSSGITTFAQDAIPTSLAAGDLWADTNDSNKLYRAASIGANEITAGEWIIVRDSASVTLDTWRHTSDTTKIDGGDIYTGTVTADKITAGTYTGGNFVVGAGGAFQSSDYSAGTTGFKLAPTTGLEVNTGTIKGTLIDTTGALIRNQVYTSGNNTWTCPTGVTKVYLTLVGGGGGGGGPKDADSYPGGGGGGGGYTINYPYTVIPGNGYAANVGSGGAGGAQNINGTAGGNTSFNGIVIAYGGGGGSRGESGGAGGGGAGGGSSGNATQQNGGNYSSFYGGNGAAGGLYFGAYYGGGGGGGSIYGEGGDGTLNAGTDGTGIGSGGGGGASGDAAGSGKAGHILITW